MSLILEALRKSESERQLGQLPGLMSPVIPVRRRRSYRRWLLPAVVLALGLGGGWWLALKLAGPSSPAVPLGAVEQVVPASRKVTATSATAKRAEHLPGASALPPASAPVVATPVEPRATEPPAPTQSATPPAAPSTPPSDAPPAPPSITAPAVPRPPTAPPDESAADLPAASAASVAGTPTATVADSVPLSQMPPAQRGTLPPLKLSVHVFADDVTRRFAIIDGRRHVEGDDLGGGVRLREIQRDGVLLDVGGQPWLLERPR